MEQSLPTLREELEQLAEQSISDEARSALKRAACVVRQTELPAPGQKTGTSALTDEERADGGLIERLGE